MAEEATIKKRSKANPLYWCGVSLKVLGAAASATVIGIPIGVPLYRAGKQLTHKNYRGL